MDDELSRSQGVLTRRYSAAVFDMDGLLIDSERPIRDAWLRAALEHDMVLSEADYLQTVGVRVADSRRVLCAALGGEDRYEAVRSRADALIRAHGNAAGFAAKSGARELLAALRTTGIVCCVASSTAHAEVRRRLQAAGLMEFFAAVTGGDEVARGKPEPDLFLLACQRIGAAPAECLVFEDSESGVQAAIAAGMDVVLVPDLKLPGADLRAAAAAVLDSLEEAVPLCRRWFRPAAPDR